MALNAWTYVAWVNDVVPQVVPWPTNTTVPDQSVQPATCAVYLAGVNAAGGG